ncbi:hypothetical protein CK230_15625 [Mesorhizobium sp. WSM3859]|nr:hypothetical protein CK230_15625 [Mesorhizobium sp. WSM3859]
MSAKQFTTDVMSFAGEDERAFTPAAVGIVSLVDTDATLAGSITPSQRGLVVAFDFEVPFTTEAPRGARLRGRD